MESDGSMDRNCGNNNSKRVRYFHGMLMTDRDFREEQIYHNKKRKLLNKMLHGWGVVCGLGLGGKTGGSTITISPGMALDCHGNEILVCEPYTINLTSETCTGTATAREKPLTAADCQELEEARDKSNAIYIGIQYNEVPTDPVPVYAPGSGCEERTCDSSRIREGFCVRIFHQAPPQPKRHYVNPSLIKRFFDECRQDIEVPSDSSQGASTDSQSVTPGPEAPKAKIQEECLRRKVEEFSKDFCSTPLDCPDCCLDEHYIILGRVEINPAKKTIQNIYIDNRSYLLTTHLLQYIFSSLFNGIDTYFEVEKMVDNKIVKEPAPDVNLIHTNPFAALCWLGRMFVEESSIKPKSEATASASMLVKKQPFMRPAPEVEYAQLRKDIDELKARFDASQKKSPKK